MRVPFTSCKPTWFYKTADFPDEMERLKELLVKVTKLTLVIKLKIFIV
jgi:hypothetical protein